MAAVIRHKYLKTGLASKASFSLVGRRDDAIVAMTVALDEEPGGILVCSRDGRILYVNSPLESALGYPAGSLIDAGANVSHLMPRGFGRFHQTRLPRAVVSSDCAAMHVPCQMGQVVILRGNQGAQVPVLLSWTTQREAATAPMYVCLARKTGPNAALAPWGFRSIEGQVEQQICLHILVDRQGSIVAVGHGTGFVKEGVAGGVFGINAETLASANVADFIEVLSATVTAARKFNPSIPVGDVMAGALEQLSRVGAASGIASFRTAFRCPPGPYSAAEDLVPARLAVQRVAATRVNLPSLRKLGVLRGEADVEAVRDGFVLDVWSANWLQGELQVSPAGVFLTASARMEVLSGRPASRLVRSALSSLFVEDTPGQVDDVLEGRKPFAELHLRHADDSTLRVSLLGSGDTVSAGKKRVTLVVRAVQETCEQATEALHRMQVILDRDAGKGPLRVRLGGKQGATKRDSGEIGSSSTEANATTPKRERSGVTFSAAAALVKNVVRMGGTVSGGEVREGVRVAEEPAKGKAVVLDEGRDDAEESTAGSEDSDDSGDESLVHTNAEEEEDGASSQGVTRSHFRRSKYFKAIYELLKKSRAMRQLSRLVLSVQGILSAGLVLHLILFVIMASLVRTTQTEISSASVAGEVLLATVNIPPLARRLQNAAKGGWWATQTTVDQLQQDLSVQVEQLFTQYRIEYTGKTQDPMLHDLLRNGVAFPVITDQDHGDGLGPRNVTIVGERTQGLLRLTSLLASYAGSITYMTQEELAVAANTSRRWLFAVDGPQVSFLGVQSTILAQAYTRVVNRLHNLITNQLVLGLVQSVVVMPICSLLTFLVMRSLLREKAALFSVFLTIPRPVLHLAAGKPRGEEGTAAQDIHNLDLSAVLTDERIVRRLEKSSGRGVDKAMRFTEAPKPLRNDEWRLKVIIAIPLAVMTGVCIGTHLWAYSLLQSAVDPVAAFEDAYRVQAWSIELRFWVNEVGIMISTNEEVSPLGCTLQESMGQVNTIANTLSAQWSLFIFGGGNSTAMSTTISSGASGGTHGSIAYLTKQIDHDLFQAKCLHQDPSNCYAPTDPLYPATSNGLNQTVRNYMVQALIFSGQSPAKIANGRFQFIWNVGRNDVEHGTHVVGNLLRHYAQKAMNTAILIEGCLLALIFLFQEWMFAFLRPEARAGVDEIKWVAQMFSRLPEKMALSALQLLPEKLDINIMDDSFQQHEEQRTSWYGVVWARITTFFQKLALGPEYQSYLQYKAWREAHGLPMPKRPPSAIARAFGWLKRMALRLVLGGTFKAWAEIDSFYQAKKGRVQPEKDEFDGTVVKAHGEDSKAPVPVKSGKVAPADVAGPAKPRVSTREDGVDKGTEKGVRWN